MQKGLRELLVFKTESKPRPAENILKLLSGCTCGMEMKTIMTAYEAKNWPIINSADPEHPKHINFPKRNIAYRPRGE